MTEEIDGNGGAAKETIWINPGNFTGDYFLDSGGGNLWTEEADKLAKIEVSEGRVSLRIYGRFPMENVISFNVGPGGEIDCKSITPVEAAEARGSILTFNTRAVTVVTGAFKGAYQVSGYRRVRHQGQFGSRTYKLIPGLGIYLEFYNLGHGKEVFAKVPAEGPVTCLVLPGFPEYCGAISGNNNGSGVPAELFINSRKVRVKLTGTGAADTLYVGSTADARYKVETGKETVIVKDYPVTVWVEKYTPPPKENFTVNFSRDGIPIPPPPLITFEDVQE